MAEQLVGMLRSTFDPTKYRDEYRDKRDLRKQRLSVGMVGSAKYLLNWRFLDDTPKIHDRHAIRDVLDDPEIVADDPVAPMLAPVDVRRVGELDDRRRTDTREPAPHILLLERRRQRQSAEFASPALVPNLVGRRPGRLRHLFVSETGVSCKAFVLWERLNVALSLGFSGTSWTEAAHAAMARRMSSLPRPVPRASGAVMTRPIDCSGNLSPAGTSRT